ncbi:sulfurtransferase TusA family protein [Candidatus Poribacteria bacterium]
MQTIYNLPETIKDDLDRFKEEVEQFRNGTASFAAFRTFRVPQGVYEQRDEGIFMLRVRLAAGGVLPHQMRTLANVSRKYGNGILHVTSRQDIQVHDVTLDDIHPGLVELCEAGLSTKGGGGNTVRNITACYDAGVCAAEAFDVAPYAVGLTEFMLPDPINYQLPRKYKIAFSGCPDDCAGATVNDLGCIAKKRGDELGFAIHVAGGMGARSRVGKPFEEFVPADEIHFVAEAVKRVFDKHGNRKNKHRARLRFLMEQIGMDRFRELYEEELAELRKADIPKLQVRDLPKQSGTVSESGASPHDGFATWREKNTEAQKQDGYYMVYIPLPLGDIAADTLEKLADVAEIHGEGMARTTQSQNMVIRWVHEHELVDLHRKLVDLDLATTPAPILRDTVACAGASTCKLGICLSRGLASAITRKLSGSDLDLDGLGKLNINISGCPNSCGRHPIGQIGLFGAARRIGGKLVPHYVIQVGGRVSEGKTRLAEGKIAIPAQDIPDFVVNFLQAFQESPQHPDYDAFLEADGRDIANQLTDRYKDVPAFEEDKNYYFDWSADSLFSLAGRGPGECGAGVFDLIEVDLASAHESLEKGALYNATALAARALLVTQGQEASDDVEALTFFDKHFVEAGLVSESFRALVENGRRSASTSDPEGNFDADDAEVSELVSVVQHLYDNMDQSLRFQPAATAEEASQPEESAPEEPSKPDVAVDKEVDYRGVVCPLNYVKTKLVLEQMASGQVLSILLDEEGGRNVPESARQDGHEVLVKEKEGDHWLVILRRA